LLAQGELVLVASYIALPVAPPDYDMAEAIKLRAMAHSFEGKVFTIVSCSTVSKQIVAAMEAVVPNARERLERKSGAFSGVIAPDGRVVGEPLIDEEGIVYAEIDLGKCIAPKQMHDIVGHYNRFDVFQLWVNQAALSAVRSWVEPPMGARVGPAGHLRTEEPRTRARVRAGSQRKPQ
jgi:aliphatic nitrilase